MTDAGNDVLEVEERFAIVPEWVLRADLSAPAKVLYAVLQRMGNTSRRRMPGRTELAQWLHCSLSSISRATKELETYGAMSVHRATRPAAGDAGQVITVNRYFLRTTDPTISVVRPAQGRPPAAYPLGHQRTTRPPVRHNRKGVSSKPPTTSARKPRLAFKAVVVEIPGEALTELGDLLDLAAQLRSIRRELGRSDRAWGDAHVADAVRRALAADCDPRQIPDALLAVARDPETRTPYRLEHAGPWWDAAVLEAQARRRQQREADAVRRAAEDAAAAAADAVRRAQSCLRCNGSGETTVTVNGRTITAACSHGHTETETA